MLLDEDLPLEVDPVAQLHEFVRVAGITVFACELASAIRIDRPLKWQIALAHHPAQQRTYPKGEILHVVPFPQGVALGRDPGNSHKFLSRRELGEERERRHTCLPLFAFYSPRLNPETERCQMARYQRHFKELSQRFEPDREM